MKKEKINSVEKIIDLYKKGQMIIVTDDEDRENEGDLMISSEKMTADDVAFMAKNGRGLICISIEEELAKDLSLPLMTDGNNSQYSTAFTISVDAKDETTTGISASDRLKTIKTIINHDSKAEDLLRPGHMFPLIAAKNGLKERSGHTEAAVDLAKIAGHFPSGVICEIMGDDGTMTIGDELESYAERFCLPILTIKDLKAYIEHIEKIPATNIPTEYGDFILYHFPSDISEEIPHIALVHKNLDIGNPVQVRVHSECLTGDLFASLRCDCGDQLKKSLEMINETHGVLIYMRQEGRGIGLPKKLEAYRLQDDGLDTVEANIHLGFESDLRDYQISAQILKKLGIFEINLITNNPLKVQSLESNGIHINKRIALEVKSNDFNYKYLKTKKEKMNHLLNI